MPCSRSGARCSTGRMSATSFGGMRLIARSSARISQRWQHSFVPLVLAAPTLTFLCEFAVISFFDIDGLPTSVGSTNFDNRSFRLNDEATLNVMDKAFANAQAAAFEADLALAHRVSYAEWQARPARERFGEWLASAIGTQL